MDAAASRVLSFHWKVDHLQKHLEIVNGIAAVNSVVETFDNRKRGVYSVPRCYCDLKLSDVLTTNFMYLVEFLDYMIQFIVMFELFI